jgi:hypothetical protein
MNVSKILNINNSFGIKVGPNLEQHFKHTAGMLNKVAEGRMLAAIIDAHCDSTTAIRTMCPDKTLELISEDPVKNICEYKVYDDADKTKQEKTIVTYNDNLWYAKLLEKLKGF